MMHDMVHDLRKNTAAVQVFFVAHTCTKSLHKAHETSCTKISNSPSPAQPVNHAFKSFLFCLLILIL